MLGGYLRIFVNYDQNDWYQLLPVAEIAYNNPATSAQGMTHQQELHFAPGAPGASDASGAPGANRCSGCVVGYLFRPDVYPTRPGAPDAPGRQPPSILHLLSALDFC